MYRQTTYNKNFWDDGQISSLKRENYNLTNDLIKTKKMCDLLQKEKKDLENRLFKAELAKNIIPQFPSDIENLLDMVNGELKSQIYSKIEKLLQCMTCTVCHEHVKRVLYVDCRHLVACVKCGEKLSDECPLCRQISKKITVYH